MNRFKRVIKAAVAIALTSVSYTHLDVYKRQLPYRTLDMKFETLDMDQFQPDVYKRHGL